MLCSGLKDEYYYWEFINIFRKIFLIRFQPYQNPLINELEKREMMCLFFANRLRFLTFLKIKAINIDEKLSKDSSKSLKELMIQEIVMDPNFGIITIISTNNYQDESSQSRGYGSQYITFKSKTNMKKGNRKSEIQKNMNLAFKTFKNSDTSSTKRLYEKDLIDIFSKTKDKSKISKKMQYGQHRQVQQQKSLQDVYRNSNHNFVIKTGSTSNHQLIATENQILNVSQKLKMENMFKSRRSNQLIETKNGKVVN
ncbi:UNKNOWN [Stylonychia lemnae]|uniref:Uncharacterized protein n=1 Tax=Stylonychia lemnae TaxID=5949 RepID=A0A078ANJ4_STYLE|nr:UNKNOWN [Stylonychia lemnae]|eukprot:CDW83496.1 UNKNOWN [Stylonychia lemnae]